MQKTSLTIGSVLFCNPVLCKTGSKTQ